ncbi:MAG: ImmA/IrrE family metallo-endopeptidase [Candidatus Galacturonibacter soehngenii]|nr:ImmA/IrrE family metallo-endopeptidase [Candidatus Galacturonibacter soehngenii]
MGDVIDISKSIPDKQFNGDRLRIARNYRGVTAGELADRVGVQRQTISMYENSKLNNPEISNLKRISDELEFPLKFFMEDIKIELGHSSTYFRSLLTTNKKYRTEQETKVQFISIIYKYLSEYLEFSPLNIPKIKQGTSPEDAAKILRDYWNLGNKPINNIIYLVESNGIIVTDFDTTTGDVDAYSHKIEFEDVQTFLIGYSKNKTAASRIHFDIAHELGHILLHDWNEDLENIDKQEFKEIEQQANDFAAAFLLPKEEFISDVGGYANKLSYYEEMKKRWKVSIAAMIRRSYKLNLIDNEEYQRLMRNMQKQGIRKVEPLDDILATAKPSLLIQAVNVLMQEEVFTAREFIDELSSDLGLSLYPNDVEKLLGLKAGTLKDEEPVVQIFVRKKEDES